MLGKNKHRNNSKNLWVTEEFLRELSFSRQGDTHNQTAVTCAVPKAEWKSPLYSCRLRRYLAREIMESTKPVSLWVGPLFCFFLLSLQIEITLL